MVWAFPWAIFSCGPVPKWSPNCKFEILTSPLGASNWIGIFLAHPSDPTQVVWAFPRAIFCCGPVPKWSPNCKFEILMFPLATYTLIRIFRLTLFSGLILQKRIVWYSHFIWCNLQENSLQKSRNLVRGFVIFVGHLCRITRSTKLTVCKEFWMKYALQALSLWI